MGIMIESNKLTNESLVGKKVTIMSKHTGFTFTGMLIGITGYGFGIEYLIDIATPVDTDFGTVFGENVFTIADNTGRIIRSVFA